MAFQTGKNISVRSYVEATFDTAPGVGTSETIRLTPSPGLSLQRPRIESQEIRSDGLTPKARLGSRSITGSYNGEISATSFDSWLEAVMRGTYTAAVAITETEMTSITTTTSTIVAAAGSWITEGVRVGDVVRLTGHAQTANNDINLIVSAVSATTITVVGTPLVADASADLTFTLTILKKLINPATPTERTFYIEEYYQDIDQSNLFGGCKIDGFTIRGTPDGMATIEFRVVGASMSPQDTGSSPYYTSPTTTTTAALVFADAQLSIDGTAVAIATAFELNANLGAATLPVIGSPNTPDVFSSQLRMTGSFSAVREDLSYLTGYDAETEYALHVLLEEPTGTPKKCVGIYVPLLTLDDASAPLGQDGAMVQTLPFTVGLNPSASGYDQTMAAICTET
jgi:hypothetical protein